MSIKKFEDFVCDDIPSVDVQQEISKDIPTFGEYRKGSDKYGGLFTKIMEWLRYKLDNADKKTKLEIPISIFEKESGVTLTQLEEFIKDKISKGLYNFEIEIDHANKILKFDKLIRNPENLIK